MAGTLRITGGALVRQRFNVPEEADLNLVRPASDRVREAIFSALGPLLQGAQVLDLFAGSGAYGFESVSRGAESVLFIEKSTDTARCIKNNIKKLKLESQCKLVQSDALNWKPSNSFNLIFVDPPYALKLPESFFKALQNYLDDQGLVVFRCKSRADFACPPGYHIQREKNYGGTWVAFLKKVVSEI